MSSAPAAAYSQGLTRIAYAWGLIFLPHVIKLGVLNAAGYKWDNSVGRANMAGDAKSMGISQSALDRARNADSAHQNGNESLPLFAAAVIAAVATGVDPALVDYGTKLYLATRVAYVSLFIFGGRNQVLGVLRTLAWGGSVYASISLLLSGSKVLAAKGL